MNEQHLLKTWPEHFVEVLAGRKTFEIRRNDRDFRVGELLVLREWDPAKATLLDQAAGYTGREVVRTITHMMEGPRLGLEAGYCILSIAELPE